MFQRFVQLPKLLSVSPSLFQLPTSSEIIVFQGQDDESGETVDIVIYVDQDAMDQIYCCFLVDYERASTASERVLTYIH